MTLDEFLVKAKINTYASGGEGGERELEDGGRELIYEEGEWRYRDRYFGFDPFIGEEVVWKNGDANWAMNYYGRLISKDISAESVYRFLKKSLKLIEKDRPFRGPREFADGDFRYSDENSGTLDGFEGCECIYYRGVKIYELKYHGGAVAK